MASNEFTPLTEAQKKLVEQNLPICKNLADRFHKRWPKFEFDDLYQDAVLGLIRAAQKFDPNLGFKFSTYAWNWCKALLNQHLLRNFSIVNYQKNDTAIREFWRDKPEPDLPLDAPISDSVNRKVLNCFPDNAPLADEKMEQDEHEYQIRKTLEDFFSDPCYRTTKRDRDIIEQRIMGESTLQELGDKHGVSRERIRQLEKKNVIRLRRAFGKLQDGEPP